MIVTVEIVTIGQIVKWSAPRDLILVGGSGFSATTVSMLTNDPDFTFTDWQAQLTDKSYDTFRLFFSLGFLTQNLREFVRGGTDLYISANQQTAITQLYFIEAEENG